MTIFVVGFETGYYYVDMMDIFVFQLEINQNNPRKINEGLSTLGCFVGMTVRDCFKGICREPCSLVLDQYMTTCSLGFCGARYVWKLTHA